VKEGIHPTLHPVVFTDGEHEFINVSTKTSAETREIDGVTHYVLPLDISSATHPFYTGKQRVELKGGRIDRFKRRYQRG
jgi:large subunit ribosomal protein L31